MTYKVKAPNNLELLLYGGWIKAKGTSVEDVQSELVLLLKRRGFYPYEDGFGFPRLRHWYNGGISIGQTFVWEPTLDHACAVVTVTKIIDAPSVLQGSEPMIFTSEKEWNHESRFREACLPLSPGVEPGGEL